MGFIRRLAYCAGVLAGVAIVAAAGTAVLTYLFTGKVSSLEVGREGPRIKLMTVDEVTNLIRERAAKARGTLRITRDSGGE